MKHRIIACLLVCLLSTGAVLAESVDWSDVREENGRVVGVVQLPDGPLYIDAPIPREHAAQDVPILAVDYRRFTAADVDRAFAALGIKRAKRGLSFFHERNTAWAQYANPLETPLSYPEPDMAYPDHAAEVSRALEMTAAFLDALGFPQGSYLLAASRWRPYRLPINAPEGYTTPGQLHAEKARAKEEKTWGFSHDSLTSVDITFMLRGVRVYEDISWATNFKDDPGSKFGDTSHGNMMISDAGEILGFNLFNFPVEKSFEPIADLPTWRQSFEHAAFHTPTVGEGIVSRVYGNSGKPTTDDKGRVWKAMKNIVTDISLYYRSDTLKTYEPVWWFTIEQRLLDE